MQITKTQIAQYALKTLVALVVTDKTATAIANNTDYNTNDITVRVGSGVAGWWVAEKLSPYTDAAVEKVADKLSKSGKTETSTAK